MGAQTLAATGALALLVALGACSKQETVSGSSKPPESFGKVDTAFFGCPKVAGTYRWPPKEGWVEGYMPDGSLRRDKSATPEFFGISFMGPGQFEIRGPSRTTDLKFVAYTQMRPGMRGPRMRERGFNTIQAYECSGGWLVVKEYDHPHPGARENYAGIPKIGAKLAPLADGGLAIGTWVRSTGQRASIMPLGNSRVSVPAPDAMFWQWARFERVEGAK